MFSSVNFTNGQDSMNKINDNLKWNYEINLNASGRLITGTFNQFIFSPKLDLDLHSKHWSISNTTHYHFNQTNGHKIEDNWYELFILSYFVKGDKLFPTAFYNYENNLMFRVDSRHLAGLGLSSQKKWNQNFIRMDLGAGYENANFNGAEFENSNLTSNHRDKNLLMFRLVHQYQFWANRISFSNMVFYRHSLKEGQDFFIRAAASLSFKVAKGLSTSIAYLYRFENVYLKRLSSTNTILIFGVIYKVKT